MAHRTIQRTYTWRLYPSAWQKRELTRWFGASRWAWNHCLERRAKAYRRRGETLTGTDCSRHLTALKKTPRYRWLGEVPSTVLVQKLRDQDRAFKNFFEGRARYPRYKKRGGTESVRLQLDQRQNARAARWQAGALDVPGLGRIKARGGRHPQQMPCMITIRRDAAGVYESLATIAESVQPRAPAEGAVGVDLGLKHLAVLSDGIEKPTERIANPRALRRAERRLKIEQRRLARKKKGSRRRERQRRRVAQVHRRVRNTRADLNHKLTRRLVDENQVIAVESLNVAGLVRSRLAKSVHDAGWGQILGQLAYKADWSGRWLVAADRGEPTTQVCDTCLERTGPRGHDGLRLRWWQCSGCGAVHDRDGNAAARVLWVATHDLPGGTGDVMRVEGDRTRPDPGASQGEAAPGEARTRQWELAWTEQANVH